MKVFGLLSLFGVGGAAIASCGGNTSGSTPSHARSIQTSAPSASAEPPVHASACVAHAPKPEAEPSSAQEGAFDRKKTPSSAKATCEVADSNIQRTEREILSGIGAATPITSRPWDGKRAPKYLDRVSARLDFGVPERTLLAKNGFVVLGREDPATYGFLFHEIYRSELPIYVSADAVLHAVFVSNDEGRLFEACRHRRWCG